MSPAKNTNDKRTYRDRLIDTMLFRGTGEVFAWIEFSPATHLQYGDSLIEILEKYPNLVGSPPRGFKPILEPAHRAGEKYVDNWGCEWYGLRDGMEGQISRHPLSDIRCLRNYKAPDPLIYAERSERNWGKVARAFMNARAHGELVAVGGERFFERVHFLRGMEDALADMMMETPEIEEIIGLVLNYNLAYLRHALPMFSPVDIVAFGDDWGSQHSSLISPALFRKYFKPGYAKMYDFCKQYGALTTQHSDGYTVELWDEFLEAGLTALNMQVNCCGVETIEKRLKGKMCIIADVDRQHILPVGKPSAVREHIQEIITRLGSPQGGLILRIDIYPDVPLENIEAMLRAVAEFKGYWKRQEGT